MAGEGRLVVGFILLIIGALSLISPFFFVALLFLILGIVLIIWGFQARENAERIRQAQARPGYLYPGQPIATPGLAYPPTAPLAPPPYPNAPGVPAERFCPSCGGANARAAAFCQRCGRALPPPP